MKHRLLAGILFMMSCVALSWFIFQLRNPTANAASFYRDFGSVMRLEKLDKYQTR